MTFATSTACRCRSADTGPGSPADSTARVTHLATKSDNTDSIHILRADWGLQGDRMDGSPPTTLTMSMSAYCLATSLRPNPYSLEESMRKPAIMVSAFDPTGMPPMYLATLPRSKDRLCPTLRIDGSRSSSLGALNTCVRLNCAGAGVDTLTSFAARVE